MITTAFFNNKGGVGKSSAVINVAHALFKLGKRVLVADCDNQKNSFSFFSDGVKQSSVNPTRYESISICHGKQIIESKEFGDSADYMLVDLPPTLGELTKKTLSLCDYVFVPIELGTFAISGIAKVTEAIAESGVRFGGCFVSKFDNKNPADHELEELLRNSLGNKVMSTRIPLSRVIKNSISYRQTAFEYMAWTNAAKTYVSLTQEILSICEERL